MIAVLGWLAVSAACTTVLVVIAWRTPVEPSMRQLAPHVWQIRYRCGHTEIIETEPGQMRLTEAVESHMNTHHNEEC